MLSQANLYKVRLQIQVVELMLTDKPFQIKFFSSRIAETAIFNSHLLDSFLTFTYVFCIMAFILVRLSIHELQLSTPLQIVPERTGVPFRQLIETEIVHF